MNLEKAGSPKKEFPSGRQEERERFPTVELPNTVVWTPERQYGPFNFEVGSRSPFGLFLHPRQADTAGSKAGFIELGTRKGGHGRSADLPSVFFKDDHGTLFRDIDVKGTGHVDDRSGAPLPWSPSPWRFSVGDVTGLMDEESAVKDARLADTFSAAGIRTHRCLAVVRLDQIPTYAVRSGEGTPLQATLVPYETLRRKKLGPADEYALPEGFVPVVQVRAFGTKTRLRDLDALTWEPAQLAGLRKEVEDAITLVALEAKDVRDLPSYLAWFARTLGQNLGRFRSLGYAHHYVTDHNITLDCRLTDFDSVTTQLTFVYGKEDFKGGRRSLDAFITNVRRLFPEVAASIDQPALIEAYTEAHEQVLKGKE